MPEEKIRSRYIRSLENLYEAIRLSDRAYIFDNSDVDWKLLGEWNGEYLTPQEKVLPGWFDRYLIGKLIPASVAVS